MTTHSRTLLTIAAAAIAVTATIAAAGQPPAGQSRAGSPGRGGPGPMPILRQLNLTDAQRDQIKALVDTERAARAQTNAQTPVRTLLDLRHALQAAIFADTPDAAQIDQLRASVAEAEATALAARVDLETKIAQILTPEQRAQARELTAQRAARVGRVGRLRGGKSSGIEHATQP